MIKSSLQKIWFLKILFNKMLEVLHVPGGYIFCIKAIGRGEIADEYRFDLL